MSFYFCKTSRRSRTRPMLAKSTNYLLSVNGFAKSLAIPPKLLHEIPRSVTMIVLLGLGMLALYTPSTCVRLANATDYRLSR